MAVSDLIVGLFFSIVLTFVSFPFAPAVNDTDADLRNNVLQLEQTVRDLQSKSQTQDQKYAAILSSVLSKQTESKDEMTKLKSELKGVKDDNKALQDELATLKVTLERNERFISILSGQFNSTSNDLAQLETDVTDMRSELNKTDMDSNPVMSELASVKSDLLTTKENLTSFKSMVMQTETSNLKYIQERFENTSSRINSTDNRLSEMSLEMNCISSKQATLAGNFSNTENIDIASLTQQLQLPHVAFQVEQRGSEIAVNSGYTLRFNSVKYNVGSHYHNKTGIFTAPDSGMYLFWVNAVVSSDSTYVTVHIQTRRKWLASAHKEIGSPASTYTIATTAVGDVAEGEQISFISMTKNPTQIVYERLSNYGGVLLRRS